MSRISTSDAMLFDEAFLGTGTSSKVNPKKRTERSLMRYSLSARPRSKRCQRVGIQMSCQLLSKLLGSILVCTRRRLGDLKKQNEPSSSVCHRTKPCTPLRQRKHSLCCATCSTIKAARQKQPTWSSRSEEHTSELQ